VPEPYLPTSAVDYGRASSFLRPTSHSSLDTIFGLSPVRVGISDRYFHSNLELF
jgi:hypothetical protein